MKRIITLLMVLTSTLFYAQTSGITYQAVLYNPNPEILPGNNNENTVLSNQDICIRFSIKDALTSLEYQETQKVKTDEFGMVNLIVGKGNQVGGYATNFDAILWNSSAKKLQVEMDVTGTCANFLEVSDQNFSAVPFAYASKIAENVSGIVPITNGGTGATTVAGAKTNLGINNIDNTSDANKPVSIATQTALNLKENAANKSTAITLGTSDVLFPTQNAVKTYVDNQITSGAVDATDTTKGKIKLAGDISGTADLPLIANNAVTTAKIADNAVTDAKITSLSSSKIIGSIPVAQVNGAVSKVNGVLPEGDGSVVIPFGMVRTGTLATRPLSSATANGDIYVVSGDSTLDNNGLTFISDGTTWNEVTPNQASLDARYLKLGGGTMSGNIVVPTTKFISIADAPILANDAANKAYVDSKVTGGATPDATTTSLGKIKLAGHLGGTADAPTVPGLANKENIITTGTTSQYFRGDKTWQTLDKSVVGLGNVDNTSDVNKPVSTAVQTALGAKENVANKSTTTTLGLSDDLYPTQNAVKTYVDTQITSVTIPDASTSVKGKIQLAGDLGGTGSSATNPVIKDAAIITAKLADASVTSVKLASASVTNVKLADASVTNAKIGELISVNKGGTGADMSTTSGYVKQATTGANFTTVDKIPVAHVDGAVRKVNGVVPDTDGNVAVIIGRVFTGATVDPNLATSIINASPAKKSSDIYVVADGSNPNNGRTFIYDGTNWLEVATDLSTTDARYVNVAGDTMEGNLTVPTGRKLIIADSPSNATDAANKNYVDTKVKIKDDGSGTTNFVPKFSAAKTLTDSSIFDDGTKVGIGTASPANTLEIKQGTAGNSGLRFTNLNSASTATTSSTKVLALNSTGDVILTNVPGTQNSVAFTTANPNSGSPVFTPNTPVDQSVVYQSAVDNSMWTYNGTTYVTYTPPASTAWNLTNTTNDAGNNKTANIWRSGGIVVGGDSSSSIYGNLTVVGGSSFSGVPAYGTASMGKIIHSSGWNGTGLLFANSNGGNNAFSMVYNGDRAFFGHLKANTQQIYGSWGASGFSLGSATEAKNSLDIFGSSAIGTYAGTSSAPSNGLIVSGKVGVGNSSPGNKLEITEGTAGNSGLRFTNLNSSSTATTSASKVLGLNSTGDVILTNIPGTQNIVDFSVNANPNTLGTTFDPNTPIDQSVIYQSAIDNSMWTYNGTTYVSYTAPASTAWNLANTNNDAGSTKTSSIWRSGNVGIGISTPVTKLHIQGPTAVQAVNASAGMFRMSRPSQGGVKWDNIAQFNLGTHYDFGNAMDAKSRLDLALTNGGDNTTLTTAMTWLANGNVGIGTSSPSGGLTIFGTTTSGLTATISGKTGITKEILFGRGGATKGSAAIAAVDEGNFGGGLAFFTKAANGSDNFPTSAIQAMNIDWLGNVGIGNTSPSAPLVVQGKTSGAGVFKLAAPSGSSAAGDNWWMGFNHGTISTDATDRARIGVDIAAGGPGRLFFTTGASGSQTRAMFIDESQRVGIGTSTPTGQFEIATSNGLSSVIRRFGNTNLSAANLVLQKTYGTTATTHGAGIVNGDFVGRILFSASNGSSYLTNGTDIVGYAAGAQSATNNGGGIFFRTVPQNSVGQSVERLRIDENGNIGIGTSAPTAQLHTTGSVLLAGAGTPGAGKVLTSDASGNATWQPGSLTTTVSNKTTNFSIASTDNGNVIVVNSATTVTVTIPSTLPAGFYCQIIQQGAGQVNVIGSGVAVTSALGTFSRTMGSSIGIMLTSSTTAFLSGDTSF